MYRPRRWGVRLVCCALFVVLLPACEITAGPVIPLEASQAIALAVSLL